MSTFKEGDRVTIVSSQFFTNDNLLMDVPNPVGFVEDINEEGEYIVQFPRQKNVYGNMEMHSPAMVLNLTSNQIELTDEEFETWWEDYN